MIKYFTLLLAATLISCGSQDTEKKEESTEQTNSADAGKQTVKGVTVSIPEGWQAVPDFEGTDLAVMSPLEPRDSFSENYNVIVTEGMGDLTLDEYASQSIDMFRANAEGFELIDEGKDVIDGTDAHRIDYKFNFGERVIHGTQYYALKNSKAYVITYSGEGKANDPYKKIFLDVLKTTKLD